MKSLPYIILLLLLAISPGACQKQVEIQTSGKVVKIGIIAPLTGEHKLQGLTGLQGIKTAQQIYPLLDNGDRIELSIMDDQDKPERSVAVLDNMANLEKPVGLLILSDSDTVLATSDRLDNYKLPALAAFATNSRITSQSPYISQLGVDDDFQGMVAALFVHDELLLERVAVFSNADNAYSRDLAGKFIEKFSSVRGQITDEIVLDDKSTGIGKLLANVRKNNPQLLYLPVDSNSVIQILKALKKMDWHPRILASDSFIRNVFKTYRHDISLMHDVMATAMYSPADKFSDLGQKAKKLYKKQYGEPDSHAILAMEAYTLMLHAINACQNHTDRQCINKQLRSVRGFTGMQNRISITGDGKASRPLYVNVINKDKITMLVKVY